MCLSFDTSPFVYTLLYINPLAELMASFLYPNRDQDRGWAVLDPYQLRSKFG